MAVPYTFSAGTLAKSSEVNANFTWGGMVPVGAILPWAKTFYGKIESNPSSITALKIVDTGETFITDGIIAGNMVKAYITYTDSTEYTTTSTSFSKQATYTLSTNSSLGYYITSTIPIQIKPTGNPGINDNAECYFTFYYTDSTSQNSTTVVDDNENAWNDHTITNPNTAKKVWKIEAYLRRNNTDSTGAMLRNSVIVADSLYAKISSVDSETQVTLDTDIVLSTIAIYTIYSTPPLDSLYVECNGQTLSDADSVYNGATIPNLNGNYNFLYGSSISGTTKTEDFLPDHNHGIYANTSTAGYNYVDMSSSNITTNYNSMTSETEGTAWTAYSIVWIMRVK